MVWDDPEVIRNSDLETDDEVHMPPEAGQQLPEGYEAAGAMGGDQEGAGEEIQPEEPSE